MKGCPQPRAPWGLDASENPRIEPRRSNARLISCMRLAWVLGIPVEVLRWDRSNRQKRAFGSCCGPDRDTAGCDQRELFAGHPRVAWAGEILVQVLIAGTAKYSAAFSLAMLENRSSWLSLRLAGIILYEASNSLRGDSA